jgi:hypothetical protein
MTETEAGILDAITTLIEVFCASGVDPEVIAQAFEAQRDGHLQKGQMDSAVVLGLLVEFARDPERRQQRGFLRRIEREPPAGTA